MSTQIAVRIPEELATFIDAEIAAGRAASRAAVVLRALERERRYRTTLADVEMLKRTEDDRDLDDLAAHVARLPLDLD